MRRGPYNIDDEIDETRQLYREFPDLTFRRANRVREDFGFMRCQAGRFVAESVESPAIPGVCRSGSATVTVFHLVAVAASWSRLRDLLREKKTMEAAAS
ncbi:MAG: hypothetical protein IAE97_00275 [Chthoniobacterales bacterium]|nr:hypothetical protein [Chthoniobacterales bacterium]